MFKVTGSVTVEFVSDGEKIEQEIDGSEFSLEEDGWRNLGDGDRQYEALFIYLEEDFKIYFQATHFDGKTTIYPLSIEGEVKIIDQDIDVELFGSDDPEDDDDN